MIGTIEQKKAFYRQALLERREDLDAAVRLSASQKICEKILETDDYRRASLILAYASVAAEVDLTTLFTAALHDGKRLAFPRCDGDDLVFCEVKNPQKLPEGRFHIPAPDASEPVISDVTGALCIVPALAVTSSCYRLGYGRGYYDRFLSAHADLVTMTPAYDALCVPRLPLSEWDRPVRFVFTERREFKSHEK